MIKLYGAEFCGPCKQIKRLLDKFGVKYKYVDVIKKKLDFTVIPVLEVAGKQYTGLSNELTKLIRDLGRKHRKKS